MNYQRTMEQSSKNYQKDRLKEILTRYRREQDEFDNHPLWVELGTTPHQFFAHIQHVLKKRNINAVVWEQKLKEAKDALQTQVREQRGEYDQVQFKHKQGLRA